MGDGSVDWTAVARDIAEAYWAGRNDALRDAERECNKVRTSYRGTVGDAGAAACADAIRGLRTDSAKSGGGE